MDVGGITGKKHVSLCHRLGMAEMDTKIGCPHPFSNRGRMFDGAFEIRKRRNVAQHVALERQPADHAGVEKGDLSKMRIDRLCIAEIGQIKAGLQRLPGKTDANRLSHNGMGAVSADHHRFGSA